MSRGRANTLKNYMKNCFIITHCLPKKKSFHYVIQGMTTDTDLETLFELLLSKS